MDAVIVLLILLFVLLAIGVPVGFAIGGATMISMFFFSDLNMVVNAQYCYSGIFSFTVMAIPYFMLAGTIMSTGGIARRIVDFASALIDFVTGALGCVSMLACMFFGALTGSGMATTSAIGGMMIPEMKRKGYDSSYAATLVCFGGIVGPIIPPSLSFVLYGASTKTSVPDSLQGRYHPRRYDRPGIFDGKHHHLQAHWHRGPQTRAWARRRKDSHDPVLERTATPGRQGHRTGSGLCSLPLLS